MAFVRRDAAAGRLITIGKDGGKPVRLKVRTLKPAEEQECRREAYGRLRGRQLGKEPAVKLFERAEAETIERAIKETLDSENFTVRLGEGDVELYARELAGKVQAGEEVLLDGRWTEALRRDLFETTPGLAKRVDDKVSKLVLGELEEEDEDTEDF